MALSAGTRLGPYEILSPLGSGGMGEVYRARDRRMGREVAIKLSAEEFSDRFEGVGPTLAMEFYRPLCFTGWSLYGNLRGTIAFGEQKESARGGFVGAPAFGSRVADEPLFIYELQVALQYCRCGWFVRGGWQAQYWDDLAGDETALGTVARGIGAPASNTRSDLGMQGFFGALGVQY